MGLRHDHAANQSDHKCMEAPAPFQLQNASVGGRGLQPEFHSADWPRIREAAYEERGR